MAHLALIRPQRDYPVGESLLGKIRMACEFSICHYLVTTAMASKVSVYWDGEDRDVEDPQRYTAGGFHPISLGDVMTAHSPPRQYRILHKLGRGAYSTVWLAETLHLAS